MLTFYSPVSFWKQIGKLLLKQQRERDMPGRLSSAVAVWLMVSLFWPAPQVLAQGSDLIARDDVVTVAEGGSVAIQIPVSYTHLTLPTKRIV